MTKRTHGTKRIIAEMTIFPVGEGTSLSRYVKKAIESINSIKGLRIQVTPMGTIVEAEKIDTILDAFRVAHKALSDMNAQRIIATLKIDDRRDKSRRMEDKVNAVQ